LSARTLLERHLAPAIARVFLTYAFGGVAGGIGGSLVDHLKDRWQDRQAAQDAATRFERLAEAAILPLVPVFASATGDRLNSQAVALALGDTLSRHVTLDFLVRHDLQAGYVLEGLRRARPMADLASDGYSEADQQLYRRALPELVKELVGIAPELQDFEAIATGAILGRLTAIIERLDRPEVERAAAFAEYERSYLDAIVETLDVVELFGLDLPAEATRHKLSIAYIPLNLDSERADRPAEGAVGFKTLLEDMAFGHGRLTILGQAGSGKSTLFRWAARAAALAQTDAQHQRSAPVRRRADAARWRGRPDELAGRLHEAERPARRLWWERVPFLIRLRDCRDGRLPDLDAYPKLAARLSEPPPAGWVLSLLKSGRALVLLDGIDEIAQADRPALHAALQAFAREFKDADIILSSRPTALAAAAWVRDAAFATATVSPMAPADRERFVESWHDALAVSAQSFNRPIDKQALVQSLLLQFRRLPTVATLATNPLLCAAICALHHHRRGELPGRQADLCAALADMLVHRREHEGWLADGKLVHADYHALDLTEKKDLLREIAHYMVRNGQSALDRERACAIIKDTLASLPAHRQRARAHPRRPGRAQRRAARPWRGQHRFCTMC
jgi:hypothetical protein